MSKSSLPAKPPLPAGTLPQITSAPHYPSYSAPSQSAPGFAPTFGAFKPRQVASPTSWQAPPNISAAPTVFAGQAATVAPTYPSHYPQISQATGQASYQAPVTWPADQYNQSTPSSIRNPFHPPSQSNPTTSYNQPQSNPYSAQNGAIADPELAQQIAQWQSAYSGAEVQDAQRSAKGGFTTRSRNNGEGVASASGANNAPLGPRTDGPGAVAGQISYGRDETQNKHNPPATENHDGKTVIRAGGGQTWSDSTLLEWDPAHLRMFVGNLAGEVTDDSLLKAFARYPSVQKARVIRDKRTTKSKGFGFVSFSDGEDFFAAAKEMQGKYIGSHPVLLKRATTEIRATDISQRGGKGRGRGTGGGSGGNGKNGVLGADTGAGVRKKLPKTKGGLPLLG